MKQTCSEYIGSVLTFAVILLLSGCAKHAAMAPPPPPPAPSAPVVSLTATPSSIQQGQSSDLTWRTENAIDINITGLGSVPAIGSRTITPGASTTYTLVAQGPGGTRDASARVTVNPSTAKRQTSQPSEKDLFGKTVHDVFFDFNQYNIRADEAALINTDADFLRLHPDMKIVLEGHCDDRGSEDYNLALGDSRASAVKQALVSRGVKPEQISTISYGREKPFCNADDEQCWQQNRRDHFALQQP